MARVPTIAPGSFAPEVAELAGRPTNAQKVELGALPAWAVHPTSRSPS